MASLSGHGRSGFIAAVSTPGGTARPTSFRKSILFLKAPAAPIPVELSRRSRVLVISVASRVGLYPSWLSAPDCYLRGI